jgi:hypothetical protein
MGFTPGGPAAPDALFHWVTKTDTGIRVTDVWKTRDAFEAFAKEKIGPLTAQAGFEGPPQMSCYDVHNYLTAG